MTAPPSSAEVTRALAVVWAGQRFGLTHLPEVAIAEATLDEAAAFWDGWCITDEAVLVPGPRSFFRDADTLKHEFALRFTATTLH